MGYDARDNSAADATPPPDDNGWKEYKVFVLNELKRTGADVSEIKQMMLDMRDWNIRNDERVKSLSGKVALFVAAIVSLVISMVDSIIN